jgi:hypothetical protein
LSKSPTLMTFPATLSFSSPEDMNSKDTLALFFRIAIAVRTFVARYEVV